MKIQFGCGRDKREGYVNCDISPEVNPDKIVDITKRLPFKDNSAEEILMSHLLEHTQKPIEVFREIYRICKNGAIVKIIVPYFSHESAFSTMDHYSFENFFKKKKKNKKNLVFFFFLIFFFLKK